MPGQRRLQMTVRQGLEPLADEAAARKDALARGPAEAWLVCAGFDTGEYRLVSAVAEAQQWRCRAVGTGVICGFDGQAVCEVEVRRVSLVEICP